MANAHLCPLLVSVLTNPLNTWPCENVARNHPESAGMYTRVHCPTVLSAMTWTHRLTCPLLCRQFPHMPPALLWPLLAVTCPGQLPLAGLCRPSNSRAQWPSGLCMPLNPRPHCTSLETPAFTCPMTNCPVQKSACACLLPTSDLDT